MQKLLKGALTFRRHVFTAYRDLFERLADGQEPEALFITCSDSRVVPNLITATDPGDLFVVRNIGNIVPPSNPNDEDNAEASALEYALNVLKVRHIVICGHSGCGAMKAALGTIDDKMPHVKKWLRHTTAAKKLLDPYADVTDPQARADLLSELNVLVQVKNLKTHPIVQERLENGSLFLHAWFFEIDSAQLYTYDPGEEEFVPITEQVVKRAMTVSAA